MKICKMCLLLKELKEFGPNKQRLDGLNSYCKPCNAQKSKNFRNYNPEKWQIQKIKNKKTYRELKGISLEAPHRYKPHDGTPYENSHGYMEYRGNLWKNHPCADRYGRVLEHRLVVYNSVKRPLLKQENIHHKNGVKTDNRLENLELWTKSHPCGQRVEDKIEWAKEFLEQYGYEVKNKE